MVLYSRKIYGDIFKVRLNRINLDYNFVLRAHSIKSIEVIWSNNYESYNRAELIMNILFFELFLGEEYSKTLLLNKGEKRERETKKRIVKIYKQYKQQDLAKCLSKLIIFSTFLQRMGFKILMSNKDLRKVDLILQIPKAVNKFFNFKGAVDEVQVTNLKLTFCMESEIKELAGTERVITRLINKDEEDEK